MQPLSGKFGAFAEYVKVASKAVAIKPATISHEDAAAMPCAGMTSYQTLHKIASVQPGETVLVNGASGGVGVYAVQIAKAISAHVIAVCGPDNAQLCRDLGADEVINYKVDSFEKAASAYDVVYDVIGRSCPKKTKASLKPGGRYITTIPSVKTAAIAAGSWLTAKILPGSYKTSHLVIVKPEPSDLTAMANMITAGTLRTIIDSRFDLADIDQAFERSQTWRARGKIIINIG
jgi:NADPH:quinone reductase-like Zn-dependent oxidoreductase